MPRCYWTISQIRRSFTINHIDVTHPNYIFSLFAPYIIQSIICKSQRFFLYYRCIGFPSDAHSFASPNGFSLLSVYWFFELCPQFCKSQRFLFCLSSYLFSEWHIVPQLYIQIKQSRTRSRKALAGCKASRRLGKQIRGLSRFLFNPMP